MSDKSLFTYVMDWNGGTYVSQISGDDIEATKKEWVEHIVLVIPEIQKEQLMLEMGDEQAILLDGLTNAWDLSLNVNGEMATINIIKTMI